MAEKTSTNVYRCGIIIWNKMNIFHILYPSTHYKISLFPLSHFRDPCSQAPSLAEPPPAVLGERAFSGDCNP